MFNIWGFRLKEKLASGVSKVYSALPEKDRLDESVLYALFLTNMRFSYKVPSSVVMALKPKSRSHQKPLSLKPMVKKRKFMKHVNIDAVERHESKRPKKSQQSTVLLDSNGAPLRRSSRQRTKTYYYSGTEDGENEKEQAEEDKFLRLAARLPEIKDANSEVTILSLICQTHI